MATGVRHNASSTDVFHALPVPATLVDTAGLILDVNEAFVEYVARIGHPFTRADRIGRPVLDFAAREDSRRLLEGLLREVFSGRPASYEESHRIAGHRLRHVEVRGRPLTDDHGQTTAALILREDVTARVQHDRRRQLLYDLHGEIWKMAGPADLERVLVAVREGLQRLELPFEDCGVNLVDESVDPPSVRFHNMTGDGQWIEAGSDRGADVVLALWRRGETAYRRDLETDDEHQEGDEIERIFAHRVRSVIDVPFHRGSFAVNSRLADAFAPSDVELIEEIAHTLADGFGRLADIQNLERRNEALERTIAERRRAEEALRESEQRYRQVVDELPIGVVHTRPDGRILYQNPYSRAAMGYSLADLEQITALDLYVDPRDREELVATLNATGEHSYEYRMRAKDGHIVWLRGRTRVVRGDAGEVLYYQGFAEDVTEQRRLEAESQAFHELREEVWRMERVEDIDRVIVAVRQCLDALEIDVEGCSIHVIDDGDEPPTVTTFRNRPGETEWVRSLTESTRDIILALWRADGPTYRRDLLDHDEFGDAQTISGNYGIVARSVLDVPFSRGTIGINNTRPDAFSKRDIQALSQLAQILTEGFGRMDDFERLEQRNRELEREIAERRQLEEQLRRAQKMEAVGQLTAGLAHNFNNILQAIVGNLELARRGDVVDPAPLLRDAEAAAHRAGEIIQHMLVFSRQDGRQEQGTIDFDRLLQQVVDICRRTFDRRIDIHLDVHQPVPQVHGDQAQLEQVLLNLLINARDAVHGGDDPRIVVTAEGRELARHALARPAATPGNYAVLCVSDNGVGIADPDLRRIFDPFFTTKAVGEGTGLGLFTAYGIADSLGGWIECDSHVGEGAQFTVLLPASAEEEAAVPAAAADPEQILGSESILVIDDEEFVLATVTRMLTSLGYRVLSAAGGETGLALFTDRRSEIDLVLLDLSMPRLSGSEVYARIREMDTEVPVLIFTGFAGGDQQPEGVGVVHKPFTMKSLAGAVRGALVSAGPES